MTFLAHVAAVKGEQRKRAEVHILDVRPWSCRTKAVFLVDIPSRLTLAPGDIVWGKKQGFSLVIKGHHSIGLVSAFMAMIAACYTVIWLLNKDEYWFVAVLLAYLVVAVMYGRLYFIFQYKKKQLPASKAR